MTFPHQKPTAPDGEEDRSDGTTRFVAAPSAPVPSEPIEAKRTGPLAHPAPRRRRWTWGLGAILLVVLVVLAVPWSSSALKRRIEQELSRRLDCRVEIERAAVWLLAGQIRLHKLTLDYSHRGHRFRFAGLAEPIWELDRAAVRIRPTQLFTVRRAMDLRVDLRLADPLFLAWEKGSLSCFPPLPDLVQERPAGGAIWRWRLSAISVEDGEMHYSLSPTDPSANARVVFSQVHLRYMNDRENRKERFSLSGSVGTRMEPYRRGQKTTASNVPVLAMVSAHFTRHGNLWTARLQTDPVLFGTTGTLPARVSGAVGKVVAAGQAQRQSSGYWDFRMVATCPQIEILGAREQETSIALQGHLDERTSRGIAGLDLSSRESHIKVALQLSANGSEDSQTTVSILRIADSWLALWNRQRPAHWPRIEMRPAELMSETVAVPISGHPPSAPFITLAATVRLMSRRPWIERPVANLLVRDVNLNCEYMPFVVRDIDLSGIVAPDRIVIRRCQGQWPNGHISLQGAHEGRWWSRREGITHLRWACALRIEDFLTTLPAAAESAMSSATLAALAKRPLLQGDLRGSGTLLLGWKPTEKRDILATRTLQGTVALRRGRIEHPHLPAPVTDIDGVFRISPPRAEIRSVRGRLMGTTATISATVEGEPFFWNNSTARCSVAANVAVPGVLRLVPDPMRSAIEKTEPRGDVALALSLSGPLRAPFRPEDIAATGTARFRNVRFRSAIYGLEGTFRDLQGQIELSDGIIRLTTATGRIERVPLVLRAEADPKAGRFRARLETSSPMTDLQAVLPRALGRYEVGGDLSSRFELEAWGADLFKKASQIRGLTSQTLSNLPFQWDLQGETLARDVQLTFESFPTSLTEINGRIGLHGLEWTFEDLTSSWGRTEKCRIGGGGRFRFGTWPAMHIDLEAPILYLDEWVRPWRRSRGSRFPPRVPNPVFELTGTLRGPKALYRGHPGENGFAEFSLVSPHRDPDVFRISNMTAKVYGGQISGQANVVFQRGNSTCTLELVAKNVALQPLIQCESGREQTFAGRLGGNGRFEWRDGKTDTLVGRGEIAVTESKFFGNIFFRRLGQLIRIPFLDNVAFVTIKTPHRILNRRVFFDNLAMEGPLLTINGYGSAGFDQSLDFVLQIGFPHLPRYAWLLDLVVQYFGKVPAAVFSLDLHGTWYDPQYGFHHLTVAEEGLLKALGQLWETVAPGSPTPPPKPSPDKKK